MSTAKFLALLFGALLLLSIVALVWRPDTELKGRTPLVWVSDNNPARTEQIAAFNAEHPGLLLRLDYGNSGAQKIILQSASGVGPDLFDFPSTDIGTYVESGVLWDVTEAAERMGFSATKNGWPASLRTYTYEGRQYGFPCNTGANILIYNKNVFDYFGVPYPTGLLTWDQFIDLARRVNSASLGANRKGPSIYACTGIDWRVFLETLHGEFFDEDGRPIIQDSPKLRTALEMHRDFLFKYRFMPTTVEAKTMSGQGGWGSGNNNQLAAGRFAMAVTGHWALIAFNRAHQKQTEYWESRGIAPEAVENPLDRPLRIGAVLIPHFAGQPPSYRVTSRVAGINVKSPRREEALAFLQYLAGPTYSQLLNESSDWLPGNPEYANLGVEPGPAALSRIELQTATEEAMKHGYSQRESPFLLSTDVNRVLNAQVSRLESDPSLSIDALLEAANSELQTLLRRNLERNPDLKALYIQRFGEAAFPSL